MSASVADVRAVIQRARDRLGGNGQRTILFLDEIHRFNKAQQDALLPAVEEGLVTLIGATTENPYFEVNSALLVALPDLRARAALGSTTSQTVVRRGARELGAELDDELVLRDRQARRRRRPRGAEHPRARRADGAGRRRCDRGAPRRGRRPQAAARLRQGRRRALRLHLGVHQVDARLGSRRGPLLPGGHARRWRGSPLHRPPDGDLRLRGRRQRRSAGSARRRRRRPGARARRAARGAAQPRPGGDLPGPSRRSRTP